MRTKLVGLVVLLLCWQVNGKKSIAVIGGGIAGASAVKFLREELGEDAEIVVFEKEQAAGGRIAHEVLKHDDRPGYQNLELGASLIYTGNHYVRQMSEDMGMTKRPVKSEWLAFWDGKSLVWESLPIKILSKLSFFIRYNFSMMKLVRVVNRIVKSFLGIYNKQAKAEAYESPKELLEAVGLFDLTQEDISSFLGKHGVRGRVVSEVVAGVNGNNYNQGNGINALAGCVSLCPLVSGSVFMLREGNAVLVQRLLAAYASALRPGQAVTRVSLLPGRRYRVWCGEEEGGEFDAVVVAAPVETARIQFEGRESGSIVGIKATKRKFQEVEAVFVRGEVKASYFRQNTGWWGRAVSWAVGVLQRKRELPAPSCVLLTEHAKALEGFSSLERCGPGVWKLFSTSRLSDSSLARLFEPSWRVVARRRWAAYPLFSPPERFASFRLVAGERIYYPNAIENAASCLEVEAVAAKNVALLAARDFGITPAALRPPDHQSHSG